MKPLALGLSAALMLLGQPAVAATVTETELSGIVAGEALCSLYRHGASTAVLKEEFNRLTQKFERLDVVDLKKHRSAYQNMIQQVMEVCPERALPEL